MNQTRKWIDISVPLRTGFVHWPGDPEPTFERIADMENGSEANVTFCRMGAHTGTHMDAPCHFLPNQAGMDTFPLEAGIGPARVLHIAQEHSAVSAEVLRSYGIRKGERILLRTRNSSTPWFEESFNPSFTAIDATGAQYLADAGVSLIGIDYLSVGLFQGDGPETHRTLLSAGIWIVEGLNLSVVEQGDYNLVCLPLRLEGADGAPARAALQRL